MITILCCCDIFAYIGVFVISLCIVSINILILDTYHRYANSKM